MSPTIPSLVRVWISPVARVVSSGGFPIRRDYDIGWTTGTIIVLRGILGHSLTLLKSKFILQLDTIVIAQCTTVNGLTDP